MTLSKESDSVLTDAAPDASRVVDQLRKSFTQGLTKDVTWRERQLIALQKMLVDHEAALLQCLREDLRKPDSEGYNEVVDVRAAATSALKNLRRWMKPKKVGTDLVNLPGTSQIVAEPYGVVLLISPWNFPLSLGLVQVVGAIAAGNAVVLKPSESAPATSSCLARLIPQYMDSGGIRVVEGGVSESKALLEQKFDYIFFTGGTGVGRIVAQAAAKHLTPVTLELGGKCPVIVESSVNLKVAAKRIAFGRFYNSGQTCLAADYLLVEEPIVSKLVDELKSILDEWYAAEGLPSKERSRLINQAQFKRLEGYLKYPGVADTIVYGGQTSEEHLYIGPTLLRDAPWDSPVLQEEIFGPILPIQTVSSMDEAIAIINSKPKPLAVYPFTENKSVAQRFVDETSSGAVLVNDCLMHYFNENLPFGGVGESGYGAYHGVHSFECFSHQKAVLKKSCTFDLPARFPPSSEHKNKILRAVLDGDLWGLVLLMLRIRQ